MTVQICYNLQNLPPPSGKIGQLSKKKRALCWSIFLFVCGPQDIRVHYSTYTSMTVGADSVEGTVTHLLGHHLVNYLADMTYSRFNYDVLSNLDNCKLAAS